MDNSLEIIRSRQAPGVLIFDFNNRLLYSNRESLALIPDIPTTGAQQDGRQSAIHEEILGLCDSLKQSLTPGSHNQNQKIAMTCTHMVDGVERLVSLRAFVIQGHDSSSDKGHIMVMAERVVENHERNFEKIKKDFNFSSRELEVLKLVCAGLSNRGIAEKLFISEYTVKDHLKHIMQKMEVSSRSAIMASLKS
jgi:DNA-binding CsgD family transcriptional regulator